MRLERELTERIGKKVDMVSARGLSHHIRPHVEAEKVVLYEQGGRSNGRSSRTMSGSIAPDETPSTPKEETIAALRLRIGKLDPQQVAAWRAMTPARRLEIVFQAYQFALDTVRLTERRNHPELSPEELAWRVTRRMQGDPRLGR